MLVEQNNYEQKEFCIRLIKVCNCVQNKVRGRKYILMVIANLLSYLHCDSNT